jgi:hypothetical protein
MPNTAQKFVPNNSQSDISLVTLGIILRDVLVDILRGPAHVFLSSLRTKTLGPDTPRSTMAEMVRALFRPASSTSVPRRVLLRYGCFFQSVSNQQPQD